MRLNYAQTRSAMIAGTRLQTNWLAMALMLGAVFGAIQLFGQQPWRLPDTPSALVRSVGFCLLAGLAFGLLTSAAFWLVLIPLRIIVIHRQNPLLFGDMELHTDAEAVEFKAERGASRYLWSDFLGFKENRIVIRLCLSKSAGFSVPKDELSPEQVAQLRGEVAGKLRRLS